MPQCELVPGFPVHECRSICKARSMFRRELVDSKPGVFCFGEVSVVSDEAGVWSDVTGVYGQSERRRESWAGCGVLRHGDPNETSAANDSRALFSSSAHCQTYFILRSIRVHVCAGFSTSHGGARPQHTRAVARVCLRTMTGVVRISKPAWAERVVDGWW
jgi:hypothetical protein